MFRHPFRRFSVTRPLARGALLVASVAPGLALASSLACPVVNYSCEAQTSPAIAKAGRATVLITVPGVGQCTGTLLNNARGDGRVFILTARHCAGAGDDSTLPAKAGAMQIEY